MLGYQQAGERVCDAVAHALWLQSKGFDAGRHWLAVHDVRRWCLHLTLGMVEPLPCLLGLSC